MRSGRGLVPLPSPQRTLTDLAIDDAPPPVRDISSFSEDHDSR